MNKIVVFNPRIHLFLISVYGEYIKDNNFEFEYPIDYTTSNSYSENDILIFTLAESNILLSCDNNLSKKVYIDIEGETRSKLYKGVDYEFNEHLDENDIIIYNWLKDKNHYFISQRHENIKHDRAITGLHYLSLCYYFAKFQLFCKSNIKFPKIKDNSYDFVTFLGKNKIKSSDRLKLLNYILDDLSSCKYNHEDFLDVVDYPLDTYDLFWNILQSFQGKINIIFETIDLDSISKENFFEKEFWFSEKTLRALLVPEPSILVLTPNVITYLKSLNFKFPYDGFESYFDVKNYINYIKEYGLDLWYSDNKHYFEHNNSIIWDVIYTKESFIKNIFLK
jgi:hypothetical protein